MRFQWDQAKDRANRRKHRISFEASRLVFNDPNIISRLDERFDYGEERWISIGAVAGSVLVVVHTTLKEDRHGEEIIRIISARKATKKERESYLRFVAKGSS